MVLLMTLGALLAAGNGAVLSLLPDLQTRTGLPDAALGIVAAASFFAALISQLGLARYADRGYARAMLLAAVVLGAAGSLVTALATVGWHLVAARLATGLAYGLFLPSARKIVVSMYPDSVAEWLGCLLGVDIAGFVIGAPIAATAVSEWGVPRTFGVFAAVLALLLVPLATLYLPPTPVVDRIAARGVMRRLAGRPQLRPAIALGAATFATIGIFDTLWARYLRDLGASTKFVAFTFLLFGLPMALLTGPLGKVADRHSPLRIARGGVAATVPCLLAYGFVDNLGVLCVIALLHSLIDASNFPATQAAVAEHCGAGEVAAGQGLLSAVQVAVGGCTALAVAPLYDRFGAPAAFGMGAALMTVACLLAQPELRSAVHSDEPA